MTITVTEEVRAAALRELRGELTGEELEEMSALHQAEVEGMENIHVPGVERPSWEEISEGLEQLLNPDREG